MVRSLRIIPFCSAQIAYTLTIYGNFSQNSSSSITSLQARLTVNTSANTPSSSDIGTPASSTSSTSTTPHVGDYILQGLGISISTSQSTLSQALLGNYLSQTTNATSSALVATNSSSTLGKISPNETTATFHLPALSNSSSTLPVNGTTTITPGGGLPRSGGGADYASQCNIAWASYSLLSEDSQYYAFGGTPTVDGASTTPVLVDPFQDPFFTTRTLCNSVILITPDAAYASTGSVSLSRFLFDRVQTPPTRVDWNHTTFIQPTCSIDPSDCIDLSKSYELLRTNAASQWWNSPRCGIVSTDCNQCTISAGMAQIIYFAVPTTVSRDLCASEPTGVLPQPAQSLWNDTNSVASVILSGQTYFADKVYISFDGAIALQGCGSQSIVGVDLADPQLDPTNPNFNPLAILNSGLITLASSELFSLRYPNLGQQYPFNFADYNEPIPWSAWYGMSWCYIGQCSTIIDPYQPLIAVPSQIRQLNPGWASCGLDWQGSWDPPIALTAVEALLPSPAAAANPKSTPSPNLAPKTTTHSVSSTPVSTSLSRPSPSPSSVQNLSPNPVLPDAPPAPDPPPDSIVSVEGQLVTVLANSQAVVVGSSTLIVGGPAATFGSAVVSVGSQGLLVGSVVSSPPLPSSPPPPPLAPLSPPPLGWSSPARFPRPSAPPYIVVTIDGTAMTAVQDATTPNMLILGTETISIGGSPMTVNGMIVGLSPSGIIVDGTIIPFLTTKVLDPSSSLRGPVSTGSLHVSNKTVGSAGGQTVSWLTTYYFAGFIASTEMSSSGDVDALTTTAIVPMSTSASSTMSSSSLVDSISRSTTEVVTLSSFSSSSGFLASGGAFAETKSTKTNKSMSLRSFNFLRLGAAVFLLQLIL